MYAGTDPPAPSRPDLPWPSQWRHGRRGALVLQLSFLSLLAITAAGVALVAAASGDPAAAVVAAGLAGLLVVIVGGVGPLSRTRRGMPPTAVTARSVDSGETGVSLPYSAWWFGWVVTLVAVVGAGLAAAAAAVALGGIGQLGGDPGRDLLVLLLAAAAVPFCGWFLFDLLRGRIRRGYVLLTPAGIHHRGLIHAEVVPWHAVRRVAAFEDRSGPMVLLYAAPGARQWRATSGVGLRRRPPAADDWSGAGVSAVRLPGRALAVDPAVLLHAIGFYLNQPLARAELAGEAGVARIRTRNLLPGAQ